MHTGDQTAPPRHPRVELPVAAARGSLRSLRRLNRAFGSGRRNSSALIGSYRRLPGGPVLSHDDNGRGGPLWYRPIGWRAVVVRLAVTPVAIAVAFLLLVNALATQAQQAATVARIGYLSATSVELDKSRVVAFRNGLRELGYVEGENIVVHQRHAAGRNEALPHLAAELVRLSVDVFVLYAGVAGVQAVKKATTTIPIVLAVSADPVGQGLVASLARPGGQVTGLADAHADVIPKRLELLRTVAPSTTRVGVLWNPAYPGLLPQWKSVDTAVATLGMTAVSAEVKGSAAADLDQAFARITRERVDALFVIPDPSSALHNRRIADFAIRNRLPLIGTVRGHAELGFLLSYGTDHHELWRRAAVYVDRILKGAKPGDLPIEQPTKFELVINLRTARALGLTISRALLLQAGHLIE